MNQKKKVVEWEWRRTSEGNWAQRRWEMKMALECMKWWRLFWTQSMRIDSMMLFSYQKLVFRFSNFEEGEEGEELNWTSWVFLGFCFGTSRFIYFICFLFCVGIDSNQVARDLTLFFKFDHVTRVWYMWKSRWWKKLSR